MFSRILLRSNRQILSKSNLFLRNTKLSSSTIRYFGSSIRDEDLMEIDVSINEDGDRIAEINGETVVVPVLEWTLEWVLSSPPDYHTFDETPIVVETFLPDNETLDKTAEYLG